MEFTLLMWIAFVTLLQGVQSQRLRRVEAEQIAPVRAGGQARLRCSFHGDNITVQYLSWTKMDPVNGRRRFVYEYSQHPPLARAYHDFIGRATILSADMNDNRYSYLRGDRSPAAVVAAARLRVRPPSEPRKTSRSKAEKEGRSPTVSGSGADAKRNGAKKERQDEDKEGEEDKDSWSHLHESIYGVFSDSQRTGRRPDMTRIDSIFRDMDATERRHLTTRLKRLEVPVTRDDIRRILLPLRRNAPLKIPARLATESLDIDNRVLQPEGSYWRRRQRRRAAGSVHHIDLRLSHVLLSDEATYECLVKPLNGPAISSSMKLVVQVAPQTPKLVAPKETLVDGDNLTLACSANVGKPEGELRWSRRLVEESTFQEVPEADIYTEAMKLANGTTVAVTKLHRQLTAADDGATFRCVAVSAILADHEPQPFTQTMLKVQYPPRGGRILFDTAVGRYYCHAQGRPSPNYSWVWLRADGRQMVLSSDRYLDLSGMRRSGYYRFHCLASNVIHGIKHTKVMATKLRVIAHDEKSTTKSFGNVDKSFIGSVPSTTVPVTSPPTTTTTTPAPTTTTTTRPPSTTTTPTVTTTSKPSNTAPPRVYTATPVVYPGGVPKSASRQLIPTLDMTGRGAASGRKKDKEDVGSLEEVEEGAEPDDYYYYYFYDSARKSREPANHLVKGAGHGNSRWFNQAKSNGIATPVPVTRRPTATPTSTASPPKPVYRSIEAKTFNWDDLSVSEPLDFSEETLDESKEEHSQESASYDYSAQDLSFFPEEQSDNSEDTKPKQEKKTKDKRRKSRRHQKPNKKNWYDYGNDYRRPTKKYQRRSEVEYTDLERSNKYEIVTATTSDEFDCLSRRPGVHGAGCRAFYRCERGRTYSVECRQPYVYNKITEKCGEPKEAPAPCGKFRDCSNKPSRKYVDAERGCNYYYTCYRGFFMGHNECNPGLVFNEHGQLCDWPENVKGVCGKTAKRKARRFSA